MTKNFQASLLLLLLSFAGAASAQVIYGSLVGSVVDVSQSAIAGATVTIKQLSTNLTRETTTNESGLYTFPNVVAGTYELTVRKEGFSNFTRTGIDVSINSVVRMDALLQVGATSQSVDVSGTAVALQTDRSEVKQDISTQQLGNLPLPQGRNYQSLFKLVPGMSAPNNGNSSVADPSRSMVFNANGASRSSNSFRIDGSSVNSVWLPQNAAYVPTLEAIEMVNVVTNAFDAEQGLAGGSAANVLIKSGTNQVHGSAFEYNSNNAEKARPYFLPASQGKPKDVYNEFGATIGGPIVKNKLFYFGSYEGALHHQFVQTLGTVPTAATRLGDLSVSTAPIYDPLTGNPDGSGRTPFAGNVIPTARLDPVAQKILSYLPQPNLGGVSSNLSAVGAYKFDRHKADVKVNYNPTEKVTSFFRFGMVHYDQFSGGVLGDPLQGAAIANAAGAPGPAFGTSYNASAGVTYVATPTFVVDGVFGYTLMDTNQVPTGLDKNSGRDVLGIPGTNGTRPFEGGFPSINVSSYTNFGFASNTTRPIYWHDPRFQYTGNASWTKGTHNIRFGVDVSRQHLNQVQPEFVGSFFGASGGFGFDGGTTTVRGGPSPNQFNAFGAFLLGQASTLGRTLIVPDNGITTRAWQESLYARDQWQVNRKLTLSYGVRWEYYPMPTRADRGLERYDPTTNRTLICGVALTPLNCGVHVSPAQFAPRFGIAYRLSETFVLRTGYGISIDPYSLARPMRTNYPILAVLNVSGPNTYTAAGTFATGIPAITAPDISSGSVATPGTYAANTLPTDFRRGYIQSWNLTLEKEFRGAWLASAGYVATRQIRQIGFVELNYGLPGLGAAGQALNRQFGRTATTPLVTNIGNSHYDSLQVKATRRFVNGFQVLASYTFSKSIGICCNDDSDGNLAINIPAYYNLNRSVSSFDRRHNLQISSVYELPFGKGKPFATSGIVAKLLGGWQLNGIFSRYSGLPFTVTSAGTSLNAPNNMQRANQVKQNVTILGGTGPNQSWFDPLAFAPVTTAGFGNAGFNILRGPGLTNLDASLFRNFKVTERFNVQFRAEAFNATNTPHFSNPSANVSNLLLNPDGTIRSLGGYTTITSTTGIGRDGIDERALRFGLRVSF